MTDGEEKPKSARWQRWLTIPNLILTTLVTTVVTVGASWAVNQYLTRTVAGEPVKVFVETDPARMSGVSASGRPAIIPSDVQTHGTPGQGCAGFHSWVVDNHGVDAGSTVLQFTAQSASDKAVLIQSVQVKIIETSPSMSGIAVTCPSAGNAQIHAISIDLDATTPTAVFTSTAPDAANAFNLAKGETESFVVKATAAKATYRWNLKLNLVVDGQPKSIDVGGTAGFTTTVGPAPDEAWEWDYGEKNEWNHYGPDPETISASSPLRPIE